MNQTIQIFIVPSATTTIENGRCIEPEELLELEGEVKYWSRTSDEGLTLGGALRYTALLSVTTVEVFTEQIGKQYFEVTCVPFAGELCVREASVRFITTVEVLPSHLVYLRLHTRIEAMEYQGNKENLVERVFVSRFVVNNALEKLK